MLIAIVAIGLLVSIACGVMCGLSKSDVDAMVYDEIRYLLLVEGKVC